MKIVLKIIIIIVFWLLAGRLVTYAADHSDLGDGLIYMLSIFLGIIVTLLTLMSDYFSFRDKRSTVELVPTMTGAVLGIAVLVMSTQLWRRDISPVILHCETKVIGSDGINIDFRADSTYKIASWYFVGSNICRGRYSIEDSLIKLESINKESGLQSQFLLIRQDGAIDRYGIQEKSVYQVDSNHHIIPLATDFRITP